MYITHYCTNISPTFKRITQYTEKERYDIADKLAKIEGSALQRFKNFEWYYQRRIKTEKWLYNAAIALNNLPIVNSPWYFVLGESDMLKKGFGLKSQAFQLDLDIINIKHITFTIGDSIAVYHSDTAPHIVYDKSAIEKLFINDQETINRLFNMLSPKHRYIEAQLWSGEYLCKASQF